ncbi:hypothetical protein [Thermopetrobacter sp. TC1]|uniref:hypothetical protein n=1 Tax=Thermopetrobacter sp. TC1 TaxID=1495045 RepID=UPI00056EA49F|nr:hypothetical protein [Thermopetrobacter sp. TC1]
MDKRKFLKDIKKKANEKGLGFVVDKKKGKGSHYMVYVGSRKATVPKRITPLMASAIKKQLGLDD